MFRKLIGAAVVALLPFAAHAAPLQPGDYDALDYDGFRSIWTPNGNSGPSSSAFVQGGGASAFWSFSNGRFTINGDGSGSLTALATNTGSAELQLDVNLAFSKFTGTPDPYCQQPGAGAARDCSTTLAGIDPSDWIYFDLDMGTLTGVSGTTLDGLTYNLTSNPNHAPQAGDAANALDISGDGFSMWFTWTASGVATGPNAGNYTYNHSGRGDINIDLAAVPLPATGLLLIAGLGGLAAARRRKTS